MAVKYTTFRGMRCSAEWKTVLDAGVKAGVLNPIDVNSLNRTMAQQQALYNNYRINGWPLAAVPNANAPHIRVGRKDHAADINYPQVTRFANWLRSKGLRVHFPVAGEAWHMEFISEAELVRAARMFASKPDKSYLTKEEKRQVELLLAKRRIAKRNGGWSKIAAFHLKQAVVAKNWLRERAAWLSKHDLNRVHRRERLRYIRSIL